MAKVSIEISNCCECKNHDIRRIYTGDSFEYVEGVYCTACNDRLVVSDDRDVRKYADIPDWCPLIKK